MRITTTKTTTAVKASSVVATRLSAVVRHDNSTTGEIAVRDFLFEFTEGREPLPLDLASPWSKAYTAMFCRGRDARITLYRGWRTQWSAIGIGGGVCSAWRK